VPTRRLCGIFVSFARSYPLDDHAMKHLILIAVSVSLSVMGAGRTDDEKKLKLDGEYTIVSGEKDGKPIPDEQLKGSIVRIAGDKIIGTDKDRKELFASTFTINADTTPMQIKMKTTTPKEMEAVGLIKKDDVALTIIYALPGGAEPKEFKTKDLQQLFVLKPAKPTSADKN
jgi:uncharacterized protein (TIGR03067 family)